MQSQEFDNKSDDKATVEHVETVDPNSHNAHHPSVEDRATALRLAEEQDPGLEPWSLRMLQFTGIALTCCLCSGDNGFDGTIMSAINSMGQFKEHFGVEMVTKKTNLLFGIYTVGQVASFIPSSILPDQIGRRWTMFVANIVLIIGTILCSTSSKNFNLFLGGRFLVGFGASVAGNAAKSYLTEITSPATRGRWMGLLNSFWYVGMILASGISVPFGRNDSMWAWRAPILLQLVPAVLNGAVILFLPESPRWLYARGHKEQAVKVLAKLHSRYNDPESPLIKLEIQEIEEMISLSGADKRWWDFAILFKGRANRYRFGMCAIISVWGQLSGNGIITYFLPVVLGLAGITNTDKQRILLLVNSIISFAAAMTGTSMIDHIGRRKLLLFSSTCATIDLAIVGGLLSKQEAGTRANAGVTFIMLFMVFFSVGWTPMQAIYPSEVLAYENRAKGLSLQGLLSSAVSLINTWALPPAFDALDYKVYFIFCGFDLLGLIIQYFFVVETKQLSLEQLVEVFESTYPMRTSAQLSKQAKAAARAKKGQA